MHFKAKIPSATCYSLQTTRRAHPPFHSAPTDKTKQYISTISSWATDRQRKRGAKQVATSLRNITRAVGFETRELVPVAIAT
jgi:hypothetical protein